MHNLQRQGALSSRLRLKCRGILVRYASDQVCRACLALLANLYQVTMPGPSAIIGFVLCVGGHIVHLGSALGQLDALPLAKYKESIRNAKTIKELMDLPYPADEIAQVCAALVCPVRREAALSTLEAARAVSSCSGIRPCLLSVLSTPTVYQLHSFL